MNDSDTKKAAIKFDNCFFLKWCHQESNRGHKDFQSFALPTELWHLVLVRSGNISFAVAKVVKLLDSASLLEIKNTDKKLVGLLSVLYKIKNISGM